jgi:hypothetical protein
MNKKIKLLLLLTVPMILLFVFGTAFAGSPNPGEGNFFLAAEPVINSIKQANGNLFIDQTLVFAFDGIMIGESIADVTCLAKPDGKTVCHGTEVFTGVVDGRTGTFVFQVAVKIDETGQLKGQSTILDGTSELANLKGEGTVAGTTASGTYTLDIHFDPN